MLAVILKIVSILGMILLVLLCVVMVLFLLILFMPIVYQIDAEKNNTAIKANIRIRWLLGLLRAKYAYPTPNKIIVKVLWFTIFDSDKASAKQEKTSKREAAPKKEDVSQKEAAPKKEDVSQKEAAPKKEDVSQKEAAPKKEAASQKEDTSRKEAASNETTKSKRDVNLQTANETITNTEPRITIKDAETLEEIEAISTTKEAQETASSQCESATANKKKTLLEKLFAKYEKIKYTIKKIYDKIKHIWENITFYNNLLQDEETKKLFSHACKRMGKILRHVCPKKMKTDVIFGAASPDTTGYAYAIYGMISPKLGKDVCVTPDFTQQILEGHVQVAGHITVFTLLINMLAVALDKRLRLFIRSIKTHSNKMHAEASQSQRKTQPVSKK